MLTPPGRVPRGHGGALGPRVAMTTPARRLMHTCLALSSRRHGGRVPAVRVRKARRESLQPRQPARTREQEVERLPRAARGVRQRAGQTRGPMWPTTSPWTGAVLWRWRPTSGEAARVPELAELATLVQHQPTWMCPALNPRWLQKLQRPMSWRLALLALSPRLLPSTPPQATRLRQRRLQ